MDNKKIKRQQQLIIDALREEKEIQGREKSDKILSKLEQDKLQEYLLKIG
ncbi:MAG: hypothetical protein WC791_03150 [Candidatus Paceibacterota bacterium]|jgi:hypothetical protein